MQVQGFINGLVTLLYFKGERIATALPKAWVKEERSRQHSDLVVFRPGIAAETFIWSPQCRPLGCSLPGIESLCGCRNARWRYENTGRHEQGDATQKFLYRCSRCKARLIFMVKWSHKFELVEAYGTKYLRCDWPAPPPETHAIFPEGESVGQREIPQGCDQDSLELCSDMDISE